MSGMLLPPENKASKRLCFRAKLTRRRLNQLKSSAVVGSTWSSFTPTSLQNERKSHSGTADRRRTIRWHFIFVCAKVEMNIDALAASRSVCVPLFSPSRELSLKLYIKIVHHRGKTKMYVNSVSEVLI